MFTTLTNWLRPSRRPARRRTDHFSTTLEQLERRDVPSSTPQQLRFGDLVQDWSNTGQITTNNAWGGVPSIEGFSGAGLASPGTNPQSITGTGGSLIVTANQSSPNTLTPGGIAEFDGLTDPTIALAGDSTNQAPYLLLYLDTTGTQNVFVSYDVRDIDGSTRVASSQVALQYRVGNTGPFIDVPAGFVGNATTGPNSATRVTHVPPGGGFLTLPAAVNDQPLVQLRIITANPTTAAEWIGIDNIIVHGNRPPTITPDSGALDYTENDALTLVSPFAQVNDPDGGDFAGGVLTADFPNGGSADDVLQIRFEGAGAGQISTSGSNVLYGATVIGTFAGGVGNTPLVVTLNQNANLTTVQALVRNIGYRNTSDDPIVGVPASPPVSPRDVRFVLSDGDGATSAAVTRTVNVIAVNDLPVVTISGPVTVLEQAPPRVIDQLATVTDPDSHDYDTGTLTVGFASGSPGDVIAIQNQGNGAGDVGFNALTGEVSFGGIVIGTVDAAMNGLAGQPLVVTFNAASAPTPASIQAVVRAVTFENTSDNPPLGVRQLRFLLNDGDGGLGTQVQVSVTITPVNDLPQIAPSLGGITYTENSAATVIDGGADLTDPDSQDFNQGSLTVDYTAGASAEDRLVVRNQGTAPGEIGTTGIGGATVTYGGTPIGSITSSGVGTTKLQVTFNASASQAAVQALIRNIAYANVSDNPSTVQRVVRFVVSDGDGGTGPAVSYTVTVVPVNDGPTIDAVDGTTVSYEAGFPATVVGGAATVTDPDSANLGGGNLRVALATGGLAADILAIRNQGTGAGLIGVSGTTVTFGGTAIGTFTGGTGGTDLVVTFNASATPAAAQALVRAVTFATPNGAGVAGDRSVTFQLTDNTATPGNIATVTVSVTSNAQPQDDFYSTNEDVTLTVAAPGVLANDPNAGPLVVDQPQNVTTANGTLTLLADGSFTYVPNPEFNGQDTFTYTWRNTTTTVTGTAVVTIIVLPVNDAPVVTLLPVPAVNEDSGPVAISGFYTANPGGGAGEQTQQLTLTVTNNRPELFGVQPAVDASGRLTYTPAPNANSAAPGVATVTVTVQDDGGVGSPADQDTTVRTFDIVVNPVNDIPSFQLSGAPPVVNEDAGPQSVPGFAINYSPGPATAADEQGQVATYILIPVSTTGGLTFSAGPAISAAGELTYTAAPNSFGSATFIVQVNDGGGTANGGQDTSAPRNMTILVNPVNDPPTATPDAVTLNWNSPPTVIDVLRNDSGAPDVGETVAVTTATQPANGTVAVVNGQVTYQPATAFVGTDTFTYTIGDGTGLTATATVTVNVVRPRTDPVDIVALGAGPGGGSLVRVFNATTGAFVAAFTAFDPSFPGGVSVATGDVNGDGVTDVVVGAGVTGGPRIMVIDGTKFGLLQSHRQIADPAALIANFFAYDPNFLGGVNVAVGDVNGDGKADIIAGTGPGGGPNVKVISGARITEVGPDGLPADGAVLASFFAYSPEFRGGVTVGAGDVNGDGFADVLTAVGPGGGAHVRAFSGERLFQVGPLGAGVQLASFFAYSPTFMGGVNVTGGDLDGDGRAEIITGAGTGGGSHVKVFDARTQATTASFLAFGSTFTGGVDVAYRTRQGQAPLLLVSAGIGGLPRVVGYAAPNLTAALSFSAFDDTFLGGVDVG